MNNDILIALFTAITTLIVAFFNVILGFILGFFGTNIIDHLRERRKTKQFYRAAYSELKQALIGLLMYVIHPDSTIDEEKARLWWNSIRNFDLTKIAIPTEYKAEYEKFKSIEPNSELIGLLISTHNSQKDIRRSQNKMMTQSKLNCTFISHNIASLSGLNIQDTSFLLNILRKIDVLNDCVERIDFAFKKTFDSSISTVNHEIIIYNYYSDCQYLSNSAKMIAKEVADLITKWQEKLGNEI
ncbi:MAG: hypothetical protein ABSE89_01080 [Sedimentisphaerales bacterium]